MTRRGRSILLKLDIEAEFRQDRELGAKAVNGRERKTEEEEKEGASQGIPLISSAVSQVTELRDGSSMSPTFA